MQAMQAEQIGRVIGGVISRIARASHQLPKP